MCVAVTLFSKYANGLSTEITTGGALVLSYKIVVKDDWWERTRARNRTVCQAPQTF